MEHTKKEKNRIILFLVLGSFLPGIGIDLYVPSLPAIAKYYNVAKHLVQFTIGFYLFGYGIGQLLISIIADCFKRKSILVLSTILFLIISIFAAISPNIYVLIIYRFLQGIFLAGISINIRALGMEAFIGLDQNKVFTYITTSFALGPIIGPLIGGYLQHFINCQANFYFFALYSFMLLVFPVRRLSVINNFLHPLELSKLVKMIRTMLFHRTFILMPLTFGLIYGLLILFNVIGPFIIQVVLKYSALVYGHITPVLGLGFFLGNLLNRFLIHKFNVKNIVMFAFFSNFIFCVIYLLLNLIFSINLLVIVIPVFFIFFICDMIFPNLMVKAFRLYPKNTGMSNALFGSIQAVVVFILTLIATLFKTETIVPMSIAYVVLLILSIILFFTSGIMKTDAKS